MMISRRFQIPMKLFADGTLEDVKGFCAVTDTSEIEKQDYILTPGRYVGIEEQEEDDEPFDEKDGPVDIGTVGDVCKVT